MHHAQGGGWGGGGGGGGGVTEGYTGPGSQGITLANAEEVLEGRGCDGLTAAELCVAEAMPGEVGLIHLHPPLAITGEVVCGVGVAQVVKIKGAVYGAIGGVGGHLSVAQGDICARGEAPESPPHHTHAIGPTVIHCHPRGGLIGGEGWEGGSAHCGLKGLPGQGGVGYGKGEATGSG